MIGMLFAGCIISLLIAAATAYLLLRFVRQEIGRIQGQQQGWNQTQEAQQQHWRASQEKRLSNLEHQLAIQIQQLHSAQEAREDVESRRFDALMHQYEATAAKARLEYQLLQLPRVEDIPLPGQNQQQVSAGTPQRTPTNLHGEDLAGRDLSSRYLSHADLGRAKLAHSKLFMSDLSWANLAGADLSDAELSAANLTNANLRGAILRGANFLVADLNHTNLIGADLRDAHSLSLDQVRTTLYDSSTLFDPYIACQLPAQNPPPSPQVASPAPTAVPFEDTNRMPAVRKAPEFQTPTGDMLPIQTTASSVYQNAVVATSQVEEKQPSEPAVLATEFPAEQSGLPEESLAEDSPTTIESNTVSGVGESASSENPLPAASALEEEPLLEEKPVAESSKIPETADSN